MEIITKIDDLVDHIYNEPFFKEYSKSLSHNNITQEEIFQEYLLKVCENPEKMIKLYNDGSFKYYSVAIIRNLVYNKYSTINKYHTNNTPEELESKCLKDTAADVCEYQEIEERTLKLFNDISSTVSKSHWYDIEVYNMYFIQGMTYRGISKLTKIPHTSIFHTIKKMKNRIREVHGNDYNTIKELRN